MKAHSAPTSGFVRNGAQFVVDLPIDEITDSENYEHQPKTSTDGKTGLSKVFD